MDRREHEARKKARQRRRALHAAAAPVDTVPLPADPAEAYDRYIIWRHQETNALVHGLTAIQRAYLADCSCWRHDADGHRLRGADIVIKSRKVYFTSLILGLIVIELIRTPGTRAITVLQRKVRTILYPIWSALMEMIGRLPRGWCEIVRHQSSEVYAIYLANGSSWEMATAGSSAAVADALARSGNPHIAHLSEAPIYEHYPTVIAAARNALPQRGSYLIAEGTPSGAPEHPFMAEYYATRDGRGSYHRSHFFPWWLDPNRTYCPTDFEFEQAFAPELEHDMGAEELRAERRVVETAGLTEGQVAWRRWAFFCGEARIRRQMRREFPEDDVTCCLPTAGESHLDAECLELVRQMVRPPAVEKKLARRWIGQVWRTDCDLVIVTTDSATYSGKDKSVVLAIDGYSGDLVGLVHGDATAAMHVTGVVWLLAALDCSATRDHWVCPEHNRDDRFGFVRDKLMHTAGLRFYWQRWRDHKTRKLRTRELPGYVITEQNRPRIIEQIELHVEGDPDDPAARGPQVEIPSALAHRDLSSLQDHNGRVAAPTSTAHHDDVAMALGGAWFMQREIAPRKRKRQAAQTMPGAAPAGSRRHARFGLR